MQLEVSSNYNNHTICPSILLHVFIISENNNMSRDMRFPTMWYVRPQMADQPAHTRSLIRALLVA